jgi:hypothetical protein
LTLIRTTNDGERSKTKATRGVGRRARPQARRAGLIAGCSTFAGCILLFQLAN